ncbi:hypothetical protein GFS31_41800 (plasmid) [Leptolyngbya sp. BL0902]|uniref:hypothetical protein n=1 Tax=Leptolyngbya sp. BL0902 TaxID=1115757 RepID=UPI0018E6DC47|nr:hypothetical protein [Leptolyngbya sp. BL0902]QQE67467.1 hypothetical protein GFS31_41800 [Leptolyngbya sp. BL0902]
MRTRHLAILALAVAGIAFLDLLEPGRGKLWNPIHHGRNAFNAYRDRADRDARRVATDDPRLAGCTDVNPNSFNLDAALGDLRRALVGESEVITLVALGTPACALGEGGYRWLLTNGLAIDITVQEGTVTRAELQR